MLLKLMGNGGGTFEIMEVTACSFEGDSAAVTLPNGSRQRLALKADAYILNNNGKTIETFRKKGR